MDSKYLFKFGITVRIFLFVSYLTCLAFVEYTFIYTNIMSESNLEKNLHKFITWHEYTSDLESCSFCIKKDFFCLFNELLTWLNQHLRSHANNLLIVRKTVVVIHRRRNRTEKYFWEKKVRYIIIKL